jgi:uracil phosphoribosyltransferase
VVPILRAGLVILEQATTVLPHCQTYHLGMVRDEETLQVIAEHVVVLGASQIKCASMIPLPILAHTHTHTRTTSV